MSAAFAVSALQDVHDRKGFACGVDALDRYLQTQVTQDIRRHIANCYVVSPVDTHIVAGYYTLSAANLAIADLPADQAKRLPRYPMLPAALIGRLAVDRRFRGQRLGAALLYDAMRRAVRAKAAVFALLVDAKDEDAASFYRRHEFLPLVGRPTRLYLPTATALELLEL